MRARLTKLAATVAALVALAVGGSALASASHKTAPPAQAPAAAQQQGGQGQLVPETSVEAADSSAEAQTGAADTDNVQQGDQTGSDQADSPGEQAASETDSTDGSGGFADTTPNALTQQEGQN